MVEKRMPPNQSNVLTDIRDALRTTPGDWGSLTQLFFDNLSTLLGALFAIQDMTGFGVERSDIDAVVWGKIVPGVGLTLVVGNAYYAWQAARLTNRWGRPYTAQPYGLNTPAAFAFVFNIMYPVYFSLVDSVGPEKAFRTSYNVALAANFITGLISTVLALFGPLILKYVPAAALLVPIAGIGIAFLGLEQITSSLSAPIVGYNTITWVFLGWYAGVRVGYGRFRCPEALQVILVGVMLGWATGLNKGQTVQDAAKLVKWYGPDWSADELFANFDQIADYLGIVIPIGISATATTLMCLVSAKNAGDPFPVRETMIVDGIGTMIASLFGSPFGTVVYIGHPAYKRSGAKTGYSLINGAIYLILSWFGILALLQSIVNQATIGPIVLFVGLMINEEALNFIPARHYPAYVIGLFPSIYDWVVNVSGRSPLGGPDSGNTNLPLGNLSWFGVLAWKRGAVLVSFVWVAILVMTIDRQWKKAAIWSSIAAFFALFGIIHMPEAGFNNFITPFWEQCSGPDVCWEHGEQWMFFTAYCMMAASFGFIEIARHFKMDSQLLDALEDETSDEFTDWFRDADQVVHSRTKSWRDELDDRRKLSEDEIGHPDETHHPAAEPLNSDSSGVDSELDPEKQESEA